MFKPPNTMIKMKEMLLYGLNLSIKCNTTYKKGQQNTSRLSCTGLTKRPNFVAVSLVVGQIETPNERELQLLPNVLALTSFDF